MPSAGWLRDEIAGSHHVATEGRRDFCVDCAVRIPRLVLIVGKQAGIADALQPMELVLAVNECHGLD